MTNQPEERGKSGLGVDGEELVGMARKAGCEARSYFEEKYEQASALYKNVEKEVTAHPLPSVAIAMTGGFLLGMLMRRK